MIQTVWSGSYGWEFCDPAGGLIADTERFTFQQFLELLEGEAASYAEEAYESADWGEQSLQQFMDGLVFYYTRRPEVMEICPEHQEDLQNLGYASIGDWCKCRISGE